MGSSFGAVPGNLSLDEAALEERPAEEFDQKKDSTDSGEGGNENECISERGFHGVFILPFPGFFSSGRLFGGLRGR